MMNICEPINDLKNALLYKDSVIQHLNTHHFETDPFVVPNEFGECHFEISKLVSKQRLDKWCTPKTLVCHDMKGGYLEDKYIDGCDKGNGYTFYRWNDIDIFIYFSHHFITIPPPGWIKIAHQNHVKILGTVITEGSNGIEICDELFDDDKDWHHFARSLINIAVLNSFDGWLLNIENPIKNTTSLLQFVTYLTTELHKINPEFIVLWYDSVVIDGSLKWQNELNDLNKDFFGACDGIFLNYTWNKHNLKRSVSKAGPRMRDVFVGLDVFGRNCFGGGGFHSNLAAQMIRTFGLSLALFAPGWTHERMPSNCGDDFFYNFCQRDHAFWLNLHPYLYTRPIIKPFTTTFYLGADKNYYNLNNQELVLTRPVHCGQSNCIQDIIDEDCFCIQLHKEGCKPNTYSYLITNASNSIQNTNRLFSCNIHVKRNIAISFVTKKLHNKTAYLNIILLVRNTIGKLYVFRLTNHSRRNSFDNYVVLPTRLDDPLTEQINKKIQFGHIGHDWDINNFIFSLPSSMNILEIASYVDGDSILLGAFGIELDLNVNV